MGFIVLRVCDVFIFGSELELRVLDRAAIAVRRFTVQTST